MPKVKTGTANHLVVMKTDNFQAMTVIPGTATSSSAVLVIMTAIEIAMMLHSHPPEQ